MLKELNHLPDTLLKQQSTHVKAVVTASSEQMHPNTRQKRIVPVNAEKTYTSQSASLNNVTKWKAHQHRRRQASEGKQVYPG